MKILLILLLVVPLALGSKECRFAPGFTSDDMIGNNYARDEFLSKVLKQESAFVKEYGYDHKTGLSLDNIELNQRTGMPLRNSTLTTPIGEALHIGILTLALNGNEHALMFYTQVEALEILQKKLNTLEKFANEHPSYGGFLPLINRTENGELTPIADANSEINARGSGELFWSIYGLSQVLKMKYPQEYSIIGIVSTLIETQVKSSQFILAEAQDTTESFTLISLMQILFTSDGNTNKLPIHLDSLSDPEVSLFVPILKMQSIKQELKNKLIDKSNLTIQYITNLFQLNSTTASIWLHSSLLEPYKQTQYGIANLYKDQKHVLSWEMKGKLVLGIVGSLSDIIGQKLSDDGIFLDFLELLKNQALQSNGFSSDNNEISLPKVTDTYDTEIDYTSCRLNDFPKAFAWGTATAAYQIEGAALTDGRGSCIWDDLAKVPGRIAHNETANVADDFYHKYKQDIAMMKNLGLKNFRMSISWSRVLPKGTTDSPNQVGIDFYNAVFDELIAAGIEPWVTLFHWDYPTDLQDTSTTGAWLGEQSVTQFNDYADFCFKTFGTKVKKWLTLNEPWTFVWQGYGIGSNAPGRCSSYMRDDCEAVGGGGDSGTEPYIAAHNVIKAHATAYQTYKTKYQKDQGGEVGIVLNCDFGEPYNSTNATDIEGVEIKAQFMYGWFADPIVFGKYPEYMVNMISDKRLPTFTTEEQALIKGSYDFLGLNHYTTKYVQQVTKVGRDWSDDQRLNFTERDVNGNLIGPFAQSTWLNVYPPGFRKLLNWVYNRYQVRFYVFENGVSVPNETEMTISQAVHDKFRVDYYKGYIQNMKDAITYDGVDVRGYFAWSLMDNFEWTDGFNTRFGMTYVDYANNQQRYLKDSALWYSQFIQTGNINAAFENPFEEQYFNGKYFLKEESI